MATIKERLDDLVRLLGDPALAEQVIQAAETTQKTVDEQGVAYKSADAPTVYTAPDGTQGIIQDGQFVALKAVEPPPAEAKADVVVEEEMGVDEGGLTLSPEDLTAIGQAVATAIAPLVGALDIESKMRGGIDELKTMFGSYQKQKDGTDAERATEIATLKAAIEQGAKDGAAFAARLAELEGEQPIATKGYRASQDAATIRKKEGDEEGDRPVPVLNDQFADITAQLFGNGVTPPTN